MRKGKKKEKSTNSGYVRKGQPCVAERFFVEINATSLWHAVEPGGD
jgi:hypothetical protein